MYVGGVESGVYGFHTTKYIQSNLTYVRGAESSSTYTIRAVMLCMSKVSKEVQNGLTHLCSSLS